MPRPSDLDAFVFEKIKSTPAYAKHPELPVLPEHPTSGNGGHDKAGLPDQANAHLPDLPDLPSHANVPDWLLG
jgi:hypothetical protein